MENLQRPDGSVVTPIGWLLIVIGIVGVFVAGSAESLNATILGFVVGNLGIGLGVLLLALGYLVRAIWFLPGREIAAQELRGNSEASGAVESCNWCGRQLPSGYRTCTSYDHERLSKVSSKVSDPVCKQQLEQRGYPIASNRNQSEEARDGQ